MRTYLVAGFLLLVAAGKSAAGGPPGKDPKPGAAPSAHALLREASDIALKQGDHERYWTDHVLLYIGEVQSRAGDFDGALRSIAAVHYPYGREHGLVELAKEVARAGKKDRVPQIVRLIKPDSGFVGAEHLLDIAQRHWIEHLIAKGHLESAAKAAKDIKDDGLRQEGLKLLAAAYAKSGDGARAARHFKEAIDVAAGLKSESDRADAFGEIAEAQRLAGAADAARATTLRLADEAEKFADPWAKVSALRECAVLFEKLKDTKSARKYFGRAIECHARVDKLNKWGALQYIAEAQASVGLIADALNTAAMIKHEEGVFGRNSCREHALYAIAVAQLKIDDAKAAVKTALSVEFFRQYRDDAAMSVVEHHIAKRDLKAALAATDYFDNPSRKTAAILKVATSHAKARDHKAAANIAGRIELVSRSTLRGVGKGFDY